MMSITSLCLLAILLPAVTQAQSLELRTCSRDNSVTIQSGATAFLGGVLSISKPGDNGYGCQPPYKYMQAIEAIRWALDLLNKVNETISTEFVTDYYVPGITLGMKLIDNCGHTEQAIGSLGKLYPELTAKSDDCTRQDSMMFGVVGPTSSHISMEMSKAAMPYNIPLISFQSTNPDLTQSKKYSNFMRTIAPEDLLLKVVVEVLGYLDWKYVTVLYDGSPSGRASFLEFHTQYVAAGHCLTAAIPFDVDEMDDDYIDSILTDTLISKATGVLYLGPNDFAKALIKRADARMSDFGQLQWMMNGLDLDESFPGTTYQRGIISISVASRFIVEFEDHWFRLDPANPPAENPWFQDWYELKNNCSVNPTFGERDCATIYGVGLTDKERELLLRANFVQDPYVEPAIMAVFTYANALRKAQKAKCPSSRGTCDALLSMSRQEFFSDFLEKVDFTFTSDERVPSLASNIYEPYLAAKKLSFNDNGDIENPSFYIWNYNNIETGAGANTFKFRRVGTYISGKLDMNMNNMAMYGIGRVHQLQPFPTSICPVSGCSPCISLPIATKYYYEPGDVIFTGIFSLHHQGSTPFSCGSLRDPNQVILLESLILSLNTLNKNLGKFKIGLLGIDDCSSSSFSHAFISQVHRGSLKIHNNGKNVLDPSTIQAFTGAHTSQLTIPIAELMNMIKKPLIGYRAGSYELSNKEKYPYYHMVVFGIREEMWAIILLLKKFGWMHVQIVDSNTYYSVDAEKAFREMAAKEGICIVAKHTIGTTLESANTAVRGLSVGGVDPTVALLDTPEHHMLLQALAANPAARNRIALIATSRWGPNDKLVEGYEAVANGLITLSQNPLSSHVELLDYLKGLRYNQHKDNPWFDEWFSHVYNCTQGSCDASVVINDAPKFSVLEEVDNVKVAADSFVNALSSLLESYCQERALCGNFLTAQNKGERFMEELRKESKLSKIFRFYNYRDSKYELVATANPEENNLVTSRNVVLFGGVSLDNVRKSCAEPCLECLYLFNYQQYLYMPGDLMIGAILNIHYAGDGPFSCGDFRIRNGAVYSEALAFAVDRINKHLASVSLSAPVKLGLLGFDGCSNPTRALAILNRIKTGMMSIGPESVHPDDIVAWITYDSETTEESALFLQKFGFPLVSPGATNPKLDDIDTYKTLFRTIPCDKVIAKGMAQFANAMGWRYVLVVNAPDSSSREAADLFRKHLQDFGICVVARYEFVTDGNMNVILRSLEDFDTNVVAVFSEADQYIDEFLNRKSEGQLGQDLRFIANRRWISDINTNAELENSVFFELPHPTITDFYNFLKNRDILNSDNPWLSSIYEEIFECNLPGSFDKAKTCELNKKREITSSQSQDVWNLPTIHAISALTMGLHNVLKEKCGDAYSKVCPKFQHDTDTHERIMAHMDNISFKDIVDLGFEFEERESNRTYKLRRYLRYPMSPADEGDLLHDGMINFINEQTLKDHYKNVKSECTDECLMCRDLDSDLRQFSFIPGRVYIIGLFDVHKKGNTPYTCGDVNDDHGMQLLEAFHFAIDYVNRGHGIFKDKLSDFILGGIGLDTCQSAARAANLVANIHSGNFELVQGSTTINVRRIEAYIGTMDTESTIRVADILSQLQIPQISYGATGMDLLNMETYDYFFRSVPADDKQARAMISYLKKFNYNNIQVIHSFDEIGEPGAKEFERLADINLVCITKNHTLGVTDDINSEARDIIDTISVQMNAEVVVLWMKDPLPILEAAAKNARARSQILFIATDKWGMHPEILKMDSIRNLLKEENLVILDVETADIPQFDSYLETKTPDSYSRNPWFKEYYEKKFSCVWDPPVQAGETLCSRAASIPRADDYIQDPYVLYVINAVFSAAKALDAAIKKMSVTDSGFDFGVSNLYQTSGERRQKVLEELRKVNFVDNTHQPFFYTKDGQSDRGFHIYNVTKDSSDPNEFIYQNVGSYNDSHFLKLDIRYDSNFTARCDPDGTDKSLEHCTCPFKRSIPSRYMKKDNQGRGLTLAYVGDIHQPNPDDKFSCGPINTGVDLQRLLAFFYALDTINANADFKLPDSIRLDGIALDSCSNGLRLGQDIYNLLSGNPLCDTDTKNTIVSPSSIVGFVVDKSHNTVPVSSMLALEDIITISPTASNGALDNPYQHPYFIRTTGSNKEQAKAILELLKDNKWDLMSVIYTDTMQHRAALEDMLSEAQKATTCISSTSALSVDASLNDARKVLNSITQQNGMRAVVLFVDPAHVRLLMEASQELRLAGQYVWIFPATWDTQKADLSGFKYELKGSLVIQHRTGILEGFINYMTKLTFTNRLGIPDDWFEEIYETLHKCNIFGHERKPEVRYATICSENEVVTPDMIGRDMSILHVILSVYSYALGLNNIPACSGTIDVAACLQLHDQKTQLIYRGILGINFKVFPEELGNQTFDLTYDLEGDGQGGYNIKYYTTNDEGSLIAKDLGTYTSLGLSNINWNEYTYEGIGVDSGPSEIVTSNCPLSTICTCQTMEGGTWQYQTSGSMGRKTCDRVGERYRNPDTGEETILKRPGTTDRFEEAWAIILTVFAAVGAFVALVLFVYLLVMYPVRGGTSILGYILSFGIIFLYLMVFPFIAHADERMCGLRRFGLGLVYALVYSALLVKLMDCWRVRGKNDSYSVKYSKLGRPAGLFFITLFLVLVQVIINSEWLILENPDVDCIFYKNMVWPRCTPDDFYDEGLVLSLCYCMFLIVFSFILGLVTYSSLQNHREPRWILAIFALSIPCWIIWCLVAVKGEMKVRDAAVAVGLLINATFILIFVPIRKLYLLHKYNVLIEEEEKLANEDEAYGKQYDNTPRLHDTGSVRGSTVGPRSYVGSGTY